jgi:hypothetical protein
MQFLKLKRMIINTANIVKIDIISSWQYRLFISSHDYSFELNITKEDYDDYDAVSFWIESL